MDMKKYRIKAEIKERTKTIPHMLYILCNCRVVFMRSFISVFSSGLFSGPYKFEMKFRRNFSLYLMLNDQLSTREQAFQLGNLHIFRFFFYLKRGAQDFIFRYCSIQHHQATNSCGILDTSFDMGNARRLCTVYICYAFFANVG